MQRRLAIAFVLTALLSVLLVGFGVLAIAQAGARNRAEDQVTRGLSVVGSLLGSEGRQLRQLETLLPATRRNLQLDQLTPVLVLDDGTIEVVQRGRGRAGADAIGRPLSPEELERLDAAENVVVSGPGAVTGFRVIPTDDGLLGGARLTLLARQNVTAVPSQTVAWFLLSSLIVIVGALVAAVLLARRLVRPIREIQGATAAIAAGQLTTRVEADGTDELAELGQSVNRMAADLERSKALDRQFLLSVSHDLRTPLTAISGYAEALEDGAVVDTSGAGAIIGSHAERLERLVGDLLDLAKLDANRFRLDLRPVELSVVSGRTVAGLAATAAGDGVTIEQRVDAEATVLADPDRLAQVIANLVDNATTFAAERVLVAITVEPSPPASGAGDQEAEPVASARLTVADDGPGFAPEDLPYVFDRLYTGSARPRRAENSTGLGLSIVRELVAAMGGTVRAGNGADGGAAIDLWLPVHRPADVTTEAPWPPPSSSGHPSPEPPTEPPRALPGPRPPA